MAKPAIHIWKYPAGNVLLSFATLMAGDSMSNLLLIFPVPSYFKTLENVPVIFGNQDKKCKRDYMWSAKYGAYTLFCFTEMKIVHFELLQVDYF